MKKILGNRVLVEQIMTVKESNLILTAQQKQDTDNFDIQKKIIMIGDEVYPEGRFVIGDIPVYGKYSVEDSIKVITSTDQRMVAHVVMHVDNIVGIDNEPEITKETSNLTLV